MFIEGELPNVVTTTGNNQGYDGAFGGGWMFWIVIILLFGLATTVGETEAAQPRITSSPVTLLHFKDKLTAEFPVWKEKVTLLTQDYVTVSML